MNGGFWGVVQSTTRDLAECEKPENTAIQNANAAHFLHCYVQKPWCLDMVGPVSDRLLSNSYGPAQQLSESSNSPCLCDWVHGAKPPQKEVKTEPPKKMKTPKEAENKQ